MYCKENIDISSIVDILLIQREDEITMSVRLRILISAVTALLFGAGLYVYLSGLEEKGTVVVAVGPITARTQISADMVRLQQVSAKDRQMLTPNAYTSVEQFCSEPPLESASL